MTSSQRLLQGILGLIAIVAIGIIGYMVIEGWGFIDSLYMTIITITTVGFNEVHPLSTGGQIFSVLLIIGGVGGALYVITGIVQYVVEGNIRYTWEKHKMKNKIAQLKEHFIICGFGVIGEEIAQTFNSEGVPFVIIEDHPESIIRLEPTEYLYLNGDATRDEILKEAGIEKARGLIVAVGTDAESIYIVLSARGIRQDLFIEARASSREAEKKLVMVGANRVILPEAIGARRMALLAMRPSVIDFVDTVVTYSRGREIQLENIDISENSKLIGWTLKSVRAKTRIATLAIKKKGGEFIPNPADEETIGEGDQMIVIGTKKHLDSLEEELQV